MAASTDFDDLKELTEGDVDLLRTKPSKFVEVVLGKEPFGYQQEVIDAESDRIAFVSGRQVGKSKTASWYALHHALTNPGNTTLITAPTRRQSSELFKKMKKEIAGSAIPDDLWGISRQTRTVIEFDNGSRVLCLPAGEDGSNIRGYAADLIIVDEAAFIPDEVFYQALLPMLATTDGTMLLLSTPFGSSGFLYDAFHNDLEEEYFTKRVATYRNPTVSDAFISNQQQQLSSIDFKQEILGQFVESASSFFTAEVIDQAMSLSTRRDSRHCYLGVDPARHGEDKSVFTSIDGNGNVFSVESETDSAITESIGRVMYLHEQFNYRKICIDETSLGGGVVDVLKADMTGRVVEGVTFSSKSKPDLYNTLKANLEQGEISLPDHSELRKELLDLEFEFTANKRMKIGHPQGGQDDFCDSLALANHAYDKGGAPRMSGPVQMS